MLGIDETRRGRPLWTRAADGAGWVKLETFETNFVDLAGTQGLLGQASGRTKANVIAGLDERGQAWKDAVQVVAMDPYATYRPAVAEALAHADRGRSFPPGAAGQPGGHRTSAAGSPGTPTAAAAGPPTRRGRPAGGCCAGGNGSAPTSSRRCGTT